MIKDSKPLPFLTGFPQVQTLLGAYGQTVMHVYNLVETKPNTSIHKDFLEL